MKVYLMRGVPGAGKSTKAKEIAASRPGAVIVSADHYFTDPQGVYRFDAKKLGEAHHQCRERFVQALTTPGVDTVIVDNTNTMKSSVFFYCQFARNCGAEIEFVEMPERDVDVLVNRNVHGVPRYAIENMLQQYEPGLTVAGVLDG
jgi:predicted kinase